MNYKKKYKILIVDDNETFRKAMMVKIIDVFGTRVANIMEASNGKEALKLIDQYEFNVVFMDINMPEMNGIDATRYIDRNKPNILVIALSMYNDFQYIEQMIKAGCRTYIVKGDLNDEALIKAFGTIDTFVK
jgi:two-component system, NarL family, response regulator DegU